MAKRSSYEPEQAHHLNLDDDLRDAQEMLVEISHKWYDVGLQLKVKPNVLNRIQSQYSNPVVCLRLTLSEWLIGINPYPTWEALAQALESCTVKEGRVAKKVRETFLVRATTTYPVTAPSIAHPMPQVASTHTQVIADLAYHPLIHIYTPAEYNPAYPPVAPTLSQQSAHLHAHNQTYITRAPAAMQSDQPQRSGIPIPSFRTHSYQQSAPSYHPHIPMAKNPTPYPSHSPYSVPPHSHYWYTQSASTPPQPHPIPSAAIPKPAPIAPNPIYHLPTQRPPQPHSIQSMAVHIQDSIDPMFHPPTQRPAPPLLPPYTAAPLMHPVDQYANYLRAYYRRRKLPIHSKWPPTGSKKYIHLAVVKKDNYLNKQQADEFTRATLHGNIEDIVKKKESLDFSGIGKKEDGSPAQLILVEGSPGIGKTTFSWKICRKWSKGKILQKYRLVVLLRLRDKRVREARNIYDLFYHSNPKLREAVATEVEANNGESVLLLYEGYDELPGKLQTQQSIFLEILFQECLPDATVLITSRPSATQFLRDKFKENIDQHIEILGFTKADVHTYVQSVIKDQQLHREFTQYLKCYPHIQGLMYVPLNAVIVTEVYKTAKLNDSEEFVPTTLTELYASLSRGMLLRYLKGHIQHGKEEWKLSHFSNLPEELHKQFHTICGIAFQGILKDEFVFDDLACDFNTLDLMQSAAELYVDQGAVVSYNFFHLTLQEFLAAVHLSQQPEEEQLQYFIQSTPSWIQEQLREQERVQERLAEQEQEREQERQRLYFAERKGKECEIQQLQQQQCPLIQELDCAIEPTTSEPLTSSLSEAPRIRPQQVGVGPVLQHTKIKPLELRKASNMQTIEPYPQQSLQLSKDSWIQRHQLQGQMEETKSTTDPSTSISAIQKQVVPPTLQTTPSLTAQGQGRLEPWQAPMTPRPTSEFTPPLTEPAGVSDTTDIGRLQLETPQLEPPVPQQPLPQREPPVITKLRPVIQHTPPVPQQPLPQREPPVITNLRPVMQHTPPVPSPAGSLPDAVLTSSHFQNVVKFTAGLTRLKSLPIASIKSILLQDWGDEQIIPLCSLHWLFEAQCIRTYCDMIGEATILTFDQTLSSMNPFDCFVLGFALSHINCMWNIHILASHIGDEGLEMLVSGMNYNGDATPPPSLKSISLDMGHCDISSVGLNHLKEMPEQLAKRITKLDLSGNRDISEGTASLLSNLTSLKTLNLRETSMNLTEVEQLADLLSHSQLHNLEYLNLRYSLDSPESTSYILRALFHNTTLREVYLREAHVSENNLSLLTSALRTNTTLRKLDLMDSNINDNMVSEITSALCDNSTLETLVLRQHLRRNAIGARGATALAEMLRRNTTLRELNVRGFSIGEEGTIKLSTSLEHNVSLETLDLGSNAIGPRGATALAEMLRRNTTLQELNVCGNFIGEEGTIKLSTSLEHKARLETLNLELNAIGPRGATALAEMLRRNTMLRELNVMANSIGEEGTMKVSTSLQYNETLEKLAIDKKYKHSLPQELPLKTKNRITFF